MRLLKILTFTSCLLLLAMNVMSQPQGQGRRNMEERVENEKKRVLEKVTDLTDDQKLIFDQIYTEYGQALKATIESNQGDFAAIREKMTVVRTEKDEALKEILNEEQLTLYQEVVKQQRQNRQNRRGQRRGGN